MNVPTAFLPFALLLLAIPSLKADVTVKEYRDAFSGKAEPWKRAFVETYILGLGNGIEQMNAECSATIRTPG